MKSQLILKMYKKIKEKHTWVLAVLQAGMMALEIFAFSVTFPETSK